MNFNSTTLGSLLPPPHTPIIKPHHIGNGLCIFVPILVRDICVKYGTALRELFGIAGTHESQLLLGLSPLPQHQLFYPNSPHWERPLSFRTNPCAWNLRGTWHSIKVMWAVRDSWHPWISTPLGFHLTDDCICIYGNRFIFFIIALKHVFYLCCLQEGHICGQSMLSKPCIK